MTGEGLFRAEAIEHRRRRLMGEVIIVQPLGQMAMSAALSLFSVAGLLYLATGSYARTETVPGYVAPTGGLAQIYAVHGGVVTEVSVHKGDIVAKGAPLLRLSLETAGAGGALGERQEAQTRSRMGEIDRQIAYAGQRYAEDGTRLDAHRRSDRAELASLEQRLSAEAQTLALQQDDARRYGKLQREGDGALLELNRRRQVALGEEGAIRALEQQREQLRGDLGETRARLAALPAERADRLSQLRSARSELAQSLAQLEVGSAYVVTAPVAGRIAALQAEAGQSVSTQTPLAALVPEGSGLEANLLVPSRSAGLIQTGQAVRLRIDAFPYQRFGMVTGHVQQISRSSYRPGELLAPIPYQDTVYRVIVALDRTRVAAYGEERPLTPGMTLSADVVTDRRHFIDWVLDPLRAVQAKTG